MATDPLVRFRAVCWSSATARDLGKIADHTARDLAIFKDQVSAGEWQLWDIELGGVRRGCLIWSVEHEGEDIALIINAAACEPVRGFDVTRAIVEAFRAMAKETGARALRCWTVREGLRRRLEKIGARSRYVMELEIG